MAHLRQLFGKHILGIPRMERMTELTRNQVATMEHTINNIINDENMELDFFKAEISALRHCEATDTTPPSTQNM